MDDEYENDSYAFEFDHAGNLTALYEMEDGVLRPERVDADETYELQADGTVVGTEMEDGGIETTVYSDADGDGLFDEISETWTPLDGVSGGVDSDDGPSEYDSYSSKGYSFDFDAQGNLIALYESEDGVLESEDIDSDESYELQSDGTVIKTEFEDDGIETTLYGDEDGDGLFQRLSETWSPSDGGESRVLSYLGTEGDDEVAVRGGDDALGGAGADTFVIREGAHVRIQDFDDMEGDHLTFDTGFGLRDTFELVQYVTGIQVSGDDLTIEFGADISVTLVGVAGSSTLGWDDVSVLS